MLSLHVPTFAELAVRRAWLADPEMMAYNAGWSALPSLAAAADESR